MADKLDGIGPALGQRIVDYRTSNGRFKDIEEIKNVSGIGDKRFEAIKDKISVR
jgi:competence protein ComEA